MTSDSHEYKATQMSVELTSHSQIRELWSEMKVAKIPGCTEGKKGRLVPPHLLPNRPQDGLLWRAKQTGRVQMISREKEMNYGKKL